MVKPAGPKATAGVTVTALGAILEQEQRASEVLARARDRARDILAEAQGGVPDIVASGESDAHRRAEQETDKIKKRVEGEVATVAAAREQELVALREQLSSRLPSAVDFVVASATNPDVSVGCGTVAPGSSAL